MRIVIFAGILICGSAGAAEVYKCTNASGVPAFQDHACASSDQESKVHVADVADVPEQSSTPVAEGSAPAGPAVVRPLTRQKESAPAMWLCVRPEDGSQYMSRDGVVQPRQLHAVMRGHPNDLVVLPGADHGVELLDDSGPDGVAIPDRIIAFLRALLRKPGLTNAGPSPS